MYRHARLLPLRAVAFLSLVFSLLIAATGCNGPIQPGNPRSLVITPGGALTKPGDTSRFTALLNSSNGIE